MEGGGVEVPAYFMCPISLQIMKDPVTAVSGITYDRESIEKWLSDGHNNICPVTKLPLPKDSSLLTPNHTLKRLIWSWCVANNAATGIDRIPANYKPPLSKFDAVKLVKLVQDLSGPSLRLQTLQELDSLAGGNENNRVCMAEAGVAKELLAFVVRCYKDNQTLGLEYALNVLYLIRGTNPFVLYEDDNDHILDSILWILDYYGGNGGSDIITHAFCVLRMVVAKWDLGTLERLMKPEHLKKLVSVLRINRTGGSNIKLQGINAALHVMLAACTWGRNRAAMIESGAMFEAIEVEINNSQEKKTTELVLGILHQLCCCADGRAQLLSHAAGIAAVSGTIMKVSPTADDLALLVLSSISRFSATSRVAQEMLRVGTVAKLCMVLQSNCASRVKDRAREILRTHYDVWKDSPCVEVIATLTKCCAIRRR